jgi:hypothetical protein
VRALDIRPRFEATGVIRLAGAFTADQAAALRSKIWQHVERQAGLRPDDPAGWPGSPVVNWRALNRDPLFATLTDNEAVMNALDKIFGVGGWRRPRPGAQILFSLPEPGPWVLPDGWHIDCGFDHPVWPVPTVKLFAFVGEVGPCGGGTILLSGTHRLVDRYQKALPGPVGAGRANWTAFLRHHPWLARLLDGADLPGYGRPLVGAVEEVDGVPVQIMELTGSPGDVVIAHQHVFHARTPDTGALPRLMVAKEIHRLRSLRTRPTGHSDASPRTRSSLMTTRAGRLTM